MALPPLSDEQLEAAVSALKTHGNQVKAAAAMGIGRSTLYDRLKRAASRGMMLDFPAAMPGFRIASVTTDPKGGKHTQQKPEHGAKFEVPKGFAVSRVTALTNSEGEEIIKWTQAKPGERDPLEIAEALKAAFANYMPGSPRLPPPVTVSEDLLTLVPCNDWHIGMFSWGKETGSDWDLGIAEDVIGSTVEEVISRTTPSGHCIVLGGGDLMHADNRSNETANGRPQDVDGRYEKVVSVATRLMVRTIDAARRRHRNVIVRILKGNHDEHAAVAVAYFLLAWYRGCPGITVDVDPSYFFWHRFGKVMLGATHGHHVKIEKMPGIMAHRRAEEWGATKFRYVHGFHLHHHAKFATEGEGVISEIHQAPIPQDSWHYGSGFCSGRSVQAITYHRETGEKGRVREVLLDGLATK